jgi:cupin fold WbuC family metalloprotein
MIKIYSKIKKKKLLHIIYNKNNYSKIKTYRLDLSSNNQFMQAAILSLKKNHTILAHKHIWKRPRFKKMIAQESWLVLSGKVRMYAYDTDGSYLKSFLLKKGSFSITYEGGHNYKALSKNPKVIEYKIGPYEGVKRDKVFI